MKLFVKHIFRTILRAPAQPLLILLTAMLSVALAITAFRLPDMFSEHIRETYGGAAELGDITVSMRGDSNTRMLFAEDAEELVGDDGRVLGEFRLTGFYSPAEGERRLLSVSAVDPVQADAFYEFDYLDYGAFTTQNLNSSAILSERAAKELGVGVGDTLALRVLEAEYTYTVQAIAANEGLLSDCDLLVSINGVTQALAARVPAIAALGDAFAPYTRLLIDVDDPTETEQILQRLTESPYFVDKLAETTDNQAKIRTQELMQTVSLWIPALLLLLLTALLIGTSLKLLQIQRSNEYALFRSCGASERQMSLLQMTESAIYSVFGAVGGILLSYPLLQYASLAYRWQTEPVTPGLSGVLFGALWAPLLMFGSTALHLRNAKKAARRANVSDGKGAARASGKRALLLPSVLTCAALLLTCLTPTPDRFIPAIAALLVLVWLIYLLAPLLSGAIAHLLELRAEKKRRPDPCVLLALKNLCSCTALRQVGRLATLLFSLLLTIVTCTSVLQKQSDLMTNIITADFVAINTDDKIERALLEGDGTAATLRFSYYPDVTLETGSSVVGISLGGEPNGCVETDFLPTQIPHRDEIAISVGVAALTDVKVGEALHVTVKGISKAFTVSEIVDTHMYFVFFDAEELGMKNDLMCVALTDAAAEEELFALIEANGAAILESNAVFDTMPQTVNGYLKLLRYAIYAAVLITLAGIENLLAEQYRARRTEKELLLMSGMTKGALFKMYACELVFAFLFSALLALPLGGAMCLLIDCGVRSFGLVLFLW